MRTVFIKNIFTFASLVMAVVLLSSCSQGTIKPDVSAYKHTSVFKNPEVSKEEMVVFIVGALGPNPLSFVRICTAENVGQWTDHRIAGSVPAGEVMVIEQPNWFPVRRLCAYSKDRYANYVGTHIISSVVHPGEHGPGLYYLGSVKTPDSVSQYSLKELYSPEITDEVRQELIHAVRSYPHLVPKNFTLE